MAQEIAQENLKILSPAVREAYEKYVYTVLTQESVVTRRAFNPFASIKVPENVIQEKFSDGNVSGILYKPKDLEPNSKSPGLIWFFWGGFVVGNSSLMQGDAVEFVQQTGAVVFTPDYSLAPENPFPAALNDAVNAYKWFHNLSFIDSSKVAVGGVSAGGGLTCMLAYQILQNPTEFPPVAGLLMDIPCLHPDIPEKLGRLYQRALSKENFQFMMSMFVPGEKRYDPNAFPLLAPSPLTKFPKTIIVAAEFDLLRETAVEFASRLSRESEQGCELHVYPGTFHGSRIIAPGDPISKQYLDSLINFANRLFQ